MSMIFIMPDSTEPSIKSSNKKRLLVIGIVIILILLMLIYILKPNKSSKNISQSQPQTIVPSNSALSLKSANGTIHVGEETIYKKDFDKEIIAFPLPHSKDLENTIIKKLITDSVILQGARDEGFLTLDTTFFNSPDKDYTKRIQTISRMKQQIIDKKIDHVAGTIFAIFFYNTEPARVGVEKGKQIALSKLTNVHDQLKSKKVSVEQAAALIQNDTSLADVDRLSYKWNAAGDFDTSINQQITFDPTVDEKIKKLNQGDVSDLFLISTEEVKGQGKIPSHYLFAYIDKKTGNNNLGSFDAWLQQKMAKYNTL